MNHGRVTRERGIHSVVSYVYADATERTGATGFTAADVGKIAYQTDTTTYWFLTATTPTWLQLATGTLVSAFADGGTSADHTFSGDSSEVLLTQSLVGRTGLVSGHTYTCTVGFRAIIWSTSDLTVSGSMDSQVDMALVVTAGVVATLQTTPIINKSRLNVTLGPAGMTMAAVTNGFTISATRPVGVGSKAFAEWWVVRYKEVTA